MENKNNDHEVTSNFIHACLSTLQNPNNFFHIFDRQQNPNQNEMEAGPVGNKNVKEKNNENLVKIKYYRR